MIPIHAHIIGGSPLFREGLLQVLTPIADRFARVDSFPCLEHYLRSVRPCRQLILSFLPDNRERQSDLLAALARIPAAAILLFGPPATLREVRRLTNQGISAYLLPSVSPENFRGAVAALLRGETYVDPQLREQWIDRELGGRADRSVGRLTRREREVLQLIVRERTTDEIARDLFISRCTVESHRANILAKLGVKNTAGLVREAVVNNLCLV